MSADQHVWYVSYGSNMWTKRLAAYLQGGVPPGGERPHPGAGDTSPPVRSVAVDLPGTLYFAGSSPQWGGGVAFYDHGTPGFTAARGHLVTTQQFAAIAAQEMHRDPVDDDPLAAIVSAALPDGRHTVGPGRYETLIDVGILDDRPLLTFTAPDGAADNFHTAPSEAYLHTLAEGLRESRDWTDDQIAQYLADRAPKAVT